MPKVLGYTPSWLSRPSPGFDLFACAPKRISIGPQDGVSPRTKGDNSQPGYVGSRRTIAHRGSEVFVVVDNEIRWSDLSIIKYDWESSQMKGKNQVEANHEAGQNYKVSSTLIVRYPLLTALSRYFELRSANKYGSSQSLPMDSS